LNALFLTIMSLAAFVAAYTFYSRFLAHRIFSIDPSLETPAHTRADGMDFVPTRPSVLFGHHFASISGLGPIVGPAIGVIYGWLPALLWVVLGTIFLGAVHDLSTLVVSLRHQGRTIGDLTEDLVGKRAKVLFLILIFFLLALAMGVFALVISKLFAGFRPEAVVPTFALIAIAMFMGTAVYKWKVPFVPASLVGIAAMLASVWAGMKFPVTSVTASQWTYVLLAYALAASVLPVWLLLQPRDYLNSFELYIGLAALMLGVLVLHPEMKAPAVHAAKNSPPLFPFLFIMIACGAISGFHNLVSSGTTARQLDKESHARIIGYGGMVAEGVLAVLVIVACTAAVAGKGAWLANYADFDTAAGLTAKLNAFIKGAGTLISSYGVNQAFAETFISVVVVAFAMTTLDTGTRLLRFNFEEMAKTFRIKPLANRYAASLLAVIAIGYFALMKVESATVANGKVVLETRPAGLILWQLFGATNQLLAAMGLLIATVYLYKKGKPIVYTFIPMMFMLAVTTTAMFTKLGKFLHAAPPNRPLIITALLLLVITVWMAAESVATIRNYRKSRAR